MNYPNFTIENSVSDFVNKNPGHAIEAFNKLDIDFCCGGNLSLKLACEEKGLNHSHVLSQLIDFPNKTSEVTLEDWTQLGLTELVDHIVTVHHKYLNDVLPRLTEAMQKVVKAHSKNHPELIELQKNIKLLREDLEPHMLKEENILFPMIRKLDESIETEGAHCGSVANPIRVMMEEHDNAGKLLNNIKNLTNNYSLPEDACGTYIFLYQKLKELVSDTHLHVHKENNLLFTQVLNKVQQN